MASFPYTNDHYSHHNHNAMPYYGHEHDGHHNGHYNHNAVPYYSEGHHNQHSTMPYYVHESNHHGHGSGGPLSHVPVLGQIASHVPGMGGMGQHHGHHGHHKGYKRGKSSRYRGTTTMMVVAAVTVINFADREKRKWIGVSEYSPLYAIFPNIWHITSCAS